MFRLLCSLLFCTRCSGYFPWSSGIQLDIGDIEFYRTVGPHSENVTDRPTLTAEKIYDDGHDLDDHWHPLLNHDDVQVGCREVRKERVISNSDCHATEPVMEVSCSGHCIPTQILPWYAQYVKTWAKYKVLEWRCVDDDVIWKNLTFVCKDGKTTNHLVKVPQGCRCKKYHPNHNRVFIPSAESTAIPSSKQASERALLRKNKGKNKHHHRKSKSHKKGKKKKKGHKD